MDVVLEPLFVGLNSRDVVLLVNVARCGQHGRFAVDILRWDQQEQVRIAHPFCAFYVDLDVAAYDEHGVV